MMTLREDGPPASRSEDQRNSMARYRGAVFYTILLHYAYVHIWFNMCSYITTKI